MIQLDKDLTIENSSKDDVTLFSSNIRGSIAIFIAQYYGIISIIIESDSIEYSSQKKEWIFLDTINQSLIFNHIIKDLQPISNSSFDPHVLKKLLDKSNHTIQNTELTNSNASNNIAQQLFCIAFQGIEKTNKFQKLSQKGSFEVLFFNCVVILEKSDLKRKNQLWEELVTLLIFYLENHNLTNQVKDLQKLLEERLILYSEQIKLIKSNSDHNYNMLYHYFFLKPLLLHSKIKIKIIQNSSLSKTIQSAGFSKIALFMIADIEEKVLIIQNLIF